MHKQLKTIILLLGTMLIFCSCTKDNNSQPNISLQQTPPFSTETEYETLVEYELNDKITQYLEMDSETISSLDNFYLTAKSSYESLSAENIIHNTYDSFLLFNENFSRVTDSFSPETEDEKNFTFELLQYCSFPAATLLGADLEYAYGTICAEKAAFDMLKTADEICSNFYKNYTPILQIDNIDISQIFTDYEENEISADNKYKNKLISVSGTVTEISKDTFDRPYVALGISGQSYGDELRCFFGIGYEDIILNIKKGDSVTVIVEVTEKNITTIDSMLWNISIE